MSQKDKTYLGYMTTEDLIRVNNIIDNPDGLDYADKVQAWTQGREWGEYKEADDPVKAPKHYMLFDDLEAIEAIRELLSDDEYIGYLKGCELKYRFRAGMKDSVEQDIGKAMQYRKFREDLR